jgi:hypothetical protein
MRYLGLTATLIAVLALSSCPDVKPTDGADGSPNGGPGGPAPVKSCSCYCSGSVLLQSCNGQLTNLGDFGTANKCQSQLGTHPGCR